LVLLLVDESSHAAEAGTKIRQCIIPELDLSEPCRVLCDFSGRTENASQLYSLIQSLNSLPRTSYDRSRSVHNGRCCNVDWARSPRSSLDSFPKHRRKTLCRARSNTLRHVIEDIVASRLTTPKTLDQIRCAAESISAEGICYESPNP